MKRKLPKSLIALLLTVLLMVSSCPIVTFAATGYDRGYSGGPAGDGYIRAKGVDISEHQGAGFNFTNLKNNGYSFVILRCGFVKRKDYRFEENYKAAKAAGLKVGAYFYSYATNASQAANEANLCLSYISGKQFEYPIYFDFEDPGANSRNADTAYSICRTFLDKVASAGYLAGLYGYAGWMDPNYGGCWVPVSRICGNKYECWMANYYDHTPTNVKSAKYPSTYGMYQYTSSNYVNGVGPLDTNVCYKDYPSIVSKYGFNGYSATGDTDKYLDPAVFNASYYRNTNADLASMTDAQLQTHWLDYGIKEGRCASPAFDVKWYLSHHADVANAFGSTNYKTAIEHFVGDGMKEGRAGSDKLPNINYYMANNLDLRSAFGTDKPSYYRHYATCGYNEGRNTSLTKPLADGVYKIYSAVDDNYALNIADQNSNNLANLQLGTASSAVAFEVKSDAYGFYTIRVIFSDKNVDVKDNATADGTNVQQYQDNGSTAQKWSVQKNSDGTYSFFTGKTAMALDLAGAAAKDGSNIQIYTRNNSNAQKWYLKSVAEDTTAPKISNLEITEITAKGYRVTCDVSDDNGITCVKMPTWTDKGGQDDIVWHIATVSNGKATYYVDIADHNIENGKYITHIYAYDAFGNSDKATTEVTVPADDSPVISNVQITELTSKGYRVTCDVSDDLGIKEVKMPTWTDKDGQDDLIWHIADVSNGKATFYVKASDHKSETGKYITHIYAYDTTGHSSCVGTGATVPAEKAPVINNVQITELTCKGYRVTCDVSDDVGIKEVKMPTWTDKDGQDDIVWHIATVSNGKATFYVKASDHKSESGKYITHIYANNINGKSTCVGTSAIVPADQPPVISNVTVTEVTPAGYRITCDVSDDVGVKEVKMPTWTEKNGQDDTIWHTATVSNGKATFYVKASDHKSESGKYITHIYAYDTAGQNSGYPISAIVPVDVAPVISNVSITDVSVNGYRITCEVSDDVGIKEVKMPTWTEKNGQDDIVWHIATVSDGKATCYVKASDHKSEGGKYTTHIYAYDTAGNKSAVATGATLPEDEPPVISDVTVTEVTPVGYRVTCNVSDDKGIKEVMMPTWTENNGQDDIVWHQATVSDGKATFYVKASDHKSEIGKYITHIYAYDTAGMSTSVAATATLPADQPPVISNVTVTEVTPAGYRVTCDVTDDVGVKDVKMPTWTENNGQDDIVWHQATVSNGKATCYVKVSDHKSESGKYITHIYAYDTAGMSSSDATTATLPVDQPPVISNVTVTDVTPAGYRVTCDVTDDVAVKEVKMPSWTDNNGQDDVVWHQATVSNGKATCYIKVSEHKYETGKYTTHIYAYDTVGNKSLVATSATTPEDQPPEISNVTVTEVSAKGYRVTCDVSDDVGVEEVKMPTWTENNGQDDVVWHNATVSNGKATCYIKVADHKYESGKYTTHIYAYDAPGHQVSAGTSATVPEDTEAPVISNVTVTEVAAGGYRVTCDVSDNVDIKEVKMPTWTENNGQDDIVWHQATVSGGKATFYVKAASHKSESGKYITHIYAYDPSGHCTTAATTATVPVDTEAPKISNVRITELSGSGYRVTCDVSDNVSIREVRMPTWTEKNGQDDIVWQNATVSNGQATFYVKVSDHKSESGKYITHIYAYDYANNVAGATTGATVPEVAGSGTTSQKNIVARANYLYNSTWVCQKTVKGWRNNYTFTAGQTYRIPYGQPVTAGSYVGFGVSVDAYRAAAANANSVFYNARSYYSGYSSQSTYYATDCSAFVSYCWGVSRKTTASIPGISTNLGYANSSNVYKLQIGDALNSNSVGHVVLVTGLTYTNGTLTQIEITEQTPPQLKRSYYTPASLASKYGGAYTIQRYNGSVPAAPN